MKFQIRLWLSVKFGIYWTVLFITFLHYLHCSWSPVICVALRLFIVNSYCMQTASSFIIDIVLHHISALKYHVHLQSELCIGVCIFNFYYRIPPVYAIWILHVTRGCIPWCDVPRRQLCLMCSHARHDISRDTLLKGCWMETYSSGEFFLKDIPAHFRLG